MAARQQSREEARAANGEIRAGGKREEDAAQ
jgi:hypothetical protein